MINDIITKQKCTGCSVCSAVCPTSCITMEVDKLGYLFPNTEASNCTECKKCIKVCPSLDETLLSVPKPRQIAIAAISKDNERWKESTSGGGFTAICETFGDDETIVYGAKFDGLKVIHDYVEGVGSISAFRRSKYVHSYVRPELYSEIKNFVESGRKVIFSGVSCQVAAVKKRLGKEYQNLLCIDIICMGSGSPTVFQSYIDELSALNKSKIKSYSFRNKRERLGRMEEYNVEVLYENNRKSSQRADLYNTSYLSALHTMEVCSNCKYQNKNRIGDITLADFKNRVMTFPDDKDIRTLSAIVFNTEKGQQLLAKLQEKMFCRDVDLSVIEKNVIPFGRNIKENTNRIKFINELGSKNVITLMKKYNNKRSFVMKIWGLLPEKLRYKIKTLK